MSDIKSKGLFSISITRACLLAVMLLGIFCVVLSRIKGSADERVVATLIIDREVKGKITIGPPHGDVDLDRLDHRNDPPVFFIGPSGVTNSFFHEKLFRGHVYRAFYSDGTRIPVYTFDTLDPQIDALHLIGSESRAGKMYAVYFLGPLPTHDVMNEK